MVLDIGLRTGAFAAENAHVRKLGGCGAYATPSLSSARRNFLAACTTLWRT